LQSVLSREGLAQCRHHAVVAETLDGADRSAVAAAGMGDAGARRRAVDLDGAGTAHAVLTSDMSAGQHQVAAEQVGELLARLGEQSLHVAIYGKRDRDLAHPAAILSTARRSAV